jgi:hypothetical protein
VTAFAFRALGLPSANRNKHQCPLCARWHEILEEE